MNFDKGWFRRIFIWLEWVAIEPENKEILALLTKISKERNMLITEIFLSGLIKDYGKHPLSTDGGGTWHPMACELLKLDNHHIILFFWQRGEKPHCQKTIQYIKDRTKSFDDYFSCCRKLNCKLEHVKQWIKVFIWHNINIRA